jgi:SAM-dependent methyltransferase
MSFKDYLQKVYYATYDGTAKIVAIKEHDQKPNARFLDCGCGRGEYTMKIAEWIGTKNVSGLEVDTDIANDARDRGISAVVGDLGAPWVFKSNSFDALHASGIIDHIFNTDMFMQEAFRVLKPGGYLLVLNNNLAAYHHIFSLLLGRQPVVSHISEKALVGTLGTDGEHWGTLGPQRLKRSFTAYGMAKMMELYGFKVESIKGVGYYPFPPKFTKLFCAIDKYHSTYFIIKGRKPIEKSIST